MSDLKCNSTEMGTTSINIFVKATRTINNITEGFSRQPSIKFGV